VRAFHLRVDLVAGFFICHHAGAEESEQAASNAKAHSVIRVLHDEQDGHIVRPAGQEQCFSKINGMGESPAKKF
jgi:hypothetical protein